MMIIRHELFFMLVVMACSYSAVAQDCSDPEQLCGEATASTDDVVLPVPVDFGCLDVANTYFYEFTTNSNNFNTGNVVADINNINCPGQTGSDTLYAMIVLPPEPFLGDPCNPAEWTQIGDCASDTLTISLESPDLAPNTTYYLIVGNNQPTNQIDCGFEVTINGPAVDINACCDDQIALGESYTLNVFGGETPPGYSWDPPSWLDILSIATPIAFPEETITYIVTGYVGGCPVTDLVTIVVGPPLRVFNTFTPNGDTVNDTWEIYGITDFENAQVNVYDRWGQLVFKSLGYAQEWDGTNNGKFLPTATYYYVIELNSLDVNIPPVMGSVTIIH